MSADCGLPGSGRKKDQGRICHKGWEYRSWRYDIAVNKGDRCQGRIVVPVEITNIVDKEGRIECDILVDTGASALVLPKAWKRKLGEIETNRNSTDGNRRSETRIG